MEELAVGATFAGHVIRAVAGRGGMGTVYRADWNGRDVALKVIAAEWSQDREYRTRFQREYHAEASIQHPNVIRVYGAGATEGRLYVTMRFVDGTDLERTLAGGRSLDPALAAGLIAQIAGALDAAHARGIVHRDVKPANVLLERDGDALHAVLTDFGLMKDLKSKAQLTVAGSIVGSSDYASPEQLLSTRVDARTDVYALGCVLFQALTGRVPYPRDSAAAAMFAHLEAPVPSLPGPFDSVIARAMAKDPEDRFASAGELGRAALHAAGG